MARILFISPTFPYPPTDGGRLRKFNTLRITAEKHEVDLLSITASPPEPESLEEVREVVSEIEYFQFPEYRFLLNTIIGFARFHPFQTHRYHFREVQKWIDARIDRYDLVYCSTVQSTPYVLGKPIKKIVDFVDSYARKYHTLGEASDDLRRYVYPIESSRLEDYERSVIRDFDQAIVISERDKSFIESTHRFDALSVIPNGVRNELLEYEHPDRTWANWKKPVIVFLGTMDYIPNEDAARYFAEDIFSIVRRTYPEATFLIVGKSPTDSVWDLAGNPQIFVTGFVDEPASFLSMADVVVAPLRYGSGLQNKILEALTLSKPVVTTSVGFEGLNATTGKHLLVADTPLAFAEKVCEVIKDPEHGQALGESGRELIENNYTWERIAPELHSVVDKALSGE